MAARSRARHSVAARASQSQQVLAQIQADPSFAQWADHPLNVPIYVTKGKGQYEGHGGGWTDLVSTLYGYIPDSVKKAVMRGSVTGRGGRTVTLY